MSDREAEVRAAAGEVIERRRGLLLALGNEEQPEIPAAEAELMGQTWIVTRPLRWRNRAGVEQEFKATDKIDFDEADVTIGPRTGGISIVDFVERGLIRPYAEADEGNLEAMSRDELLEFCDQAKIDGPDGTPFSRSTRKDVLLAVATAHLTGLADDAADDVPGADDAPDAAKEV